MKTSRNSESVQKDPAETTLIKYERFETVYSAIEELYESHMMGPRGPVCLMHFL
jgi:hypothetical protein